MLCRITRIIDKEKMINLKDILIKIHMMSTYDARCILSGRRLDSDWTLIVFYLDADWTLTGRSLYSIWTPTGRSLYSIWTPTGL